MPQIREIVETVADLLRLNEEWIDILEKAFDPGRRIKDNFKDWYKGDDGRFVRRIVALLVFLSLINLIATIVRQTSLGAEFGPIVSLVSLTHAREGLYATEAIVLIVITINIILFPNYRQINTKNPVLGAAAGATDRFLGFWPYLWLSWFALYLTLTLEAFEVLRQSPVEHAFVNACNNLSGVVIFSMYYEMAERTDSGPASQQGKLFIPAIMILLVLFAFELILSNRLPSHAERISYIFSFVSGIIIGVVTGLLVTKLGSRIINLPIWASTFLTVYAVIQPIFPIIAQSKVDFDKTLGIMLAIVGFYGKVFLLAVIHWARDTNRLLYYMARARRIYDEEEAPEYREAFSLATAKLQEASYEGSPGE